MQNTSIAKGSGSVGVNGFMVLIILSVASLRDVWQKLPPTITFSRFMVMETSVCSRFKSACGRMCADLIQLTLGKLSIIL